MRYEAIPKLSREEIESAISRDDPEELVYAVLSAALHSDDSGWAEDICVRLSDHGHFNVRGVAILGFAHIARIHRTLDEFRVKPIVNSSLDDEHEFVRGHAHDAVDDLEWFLGWKFDLG